MDNVDILCDSSALISLTDSCLDGVLSFLNNKFRFRFVIPPSVEDESINAPLKRGLKKYFFSAIKLKHALNNNVICKLKQDVAPEKVNGIMHIANNLFFIRGKPLQMLHTGEVEMLALTTELGINTILIDERTTRMLIEAPFRMKEHMEEEFGAAILIHKDNLQKFSDMTKNIQVIRSSELLAIAYENGYMDKFEGIKKSAFESALYKIKFSGCAIRFDEIEELIKAF